MLFSFTSRIISALAAFLYPGYASYKTLSQRPASEAELERWLMYWSVLGCIVGVEYLAEWLVSWIPLYSTMKAIFLLYLALPQTQGATFVYQAYLRPFFETHEQQIDMAIAEIRGRAYRFLQEKFRALWAAVVGTLAPGADGTVAGQGPTQPPPTMNNPAGGLSQLLSSLWTSYGPGIIAGGAALLRQTATATGVVGAAPAGQSSAGAQPSNNALNTPPGSTFMNPAGNTSAESVAERRKQLEAELAALAAYSSTAPIPTPSMNNPARPSTSSTTRSSSSSSFSVRERTISGKFEEIKGGEIEGYEVDDDFVGGFVAGGQGQQTSTGRGSGWLSGWGSGSGKGAYERVKSD
ncbi:unnamed protein product [Cyclocybe aegerita]|uniref:Protein YOP1 n=1 Tax=Cyclocybe aegerita TaxID=1973307 RepID=A0A8S0VS84_CYCAE|nr:unnamed protein product [Cyclocybe aegerita]